MGKSVLPYSQAVEAQRRQWAEFRRALRREDQLYFDRVFDLARRHSPSGVAQSAWDPFAPVCLANLIELHKTMDRLMERLSRLEQQKGL
ncbi:MAG: hypothetical protein OEW12_02035 [Deltaproteobacteria bacterium]|nr:hypothetical protein [Deltaproteobacteria bacterium]